VTARYRLRVAVRWPGRRVWHLLWVAAWGTLAAAAALAMAPSAERPSSPGPSPPAPKRQPAHRLREGAEVVDQLGRFQFADDRLVFVAEPANQRFVALENLNLERILRAVADRPAQSQWKVSGTVTECRGINVILIRRAMLRHPSLLDTHPGGNMMGEASERSIPASKGAVPAGAGPDRERVGGPSR